jgi:hypothetical protein
MSATKKRRSVYLANRAIRSDHAGRIPEEQRWVDADSGTSSPPR